MTLPPVKAFITGSEGPRFSRDEKAFLRDERPLGYILFKRNCRERAEIEDLVAEYRDLVGWPDALVLIDQEGGRVQRLGPPEWEKFPPGRVFGELGEREPHEGERAAWLSSRLIAADLAKLGINVDCLPVLDIAAEGGHSVIGDRAYSADPDLVARIGRAAAEGLLAGRVLPVIKHIPGHGRAGADSHVELPVVETGRDTLEASDFVPFARLADMPLAMTAHVVYRAYDGAHPATTSAIMVGEVIRGRIGFGGVLMSDDLSMGALSGDLDARTAAAFDAGCDLGLHCNGTFLEMRAVAGRSPGLKGDALARVEAAMARLKPAQPFDAEAGWAELRELAEMAGWPPAPKAA
jgi:beta-N-acetylhexosaminidase